LYKTKSTPLRDAFYNLWCSIILLPPECLHGLYGEEAART